MNRRRFRSYEPLEGDLSGLLFREEGRTIIGVNTMHPKPRQRFTIAHELGHLELHEGYGIHVDHKFPIMRKRDGRSSQAVDFDEIEANGFAAELLMPAEMLERDLHDKDLDFEDDEMIRQLADRYHVSLQAMAIRLGNLRLQD
jgi:Zn-dependent peptidase ImmA (M78 family)